ncbi:GNAT family N-acetyltransferase [Clostridium thermosuccinogenes]|nr:GNAT family N-acetyltransferase [Pseudoclostridium thermosuccinogenes]
MKTLETERLILRPFEESDFEAVHAYASVAENIQYMLWGPNDESQTRAFISQAIAQSRENPCRNYQYAAVLKSSQKLIGGCNLAMIDDDQAEIGWILHRDYWKQGFGTEMGKRIVEFGFRDLGLRRIIAHCDTENYGSYRVMERIGMRREGCFIEARPASKFSEKKYGDEYLYAILKDEWEVLQEISYYNSLPVIFDGFIEIPELTDGEIELYCVGKKPAIPEKKWVPAYDFEIRQGGSRVGEISLRIGYTDGLYYGGQIGYGVDEQHRGHGYAEKACRLLVPVIRAHGMKKVLITNNHTNIASKRTCEKLGAKLIRVARLPEWHDLYKEGQRYVNIFEWDTGA